MSGQTGRFKGETRWFELCAYFPDTDTRFLTVRIASPSNLRASDYDRPERFTLQITSG
jgi:hypothetical protein